ncbi:response regulator [uncultured Thiodictyon sp.]|uniref:response regulator n=1 Tax=uncultured Thiodictyon sp. TaxID=1846217 RepID=UPI0025D7D555|nr:response regulator [uncultured Thiodictyon sp.]
MSDQAQVPRHPIDLILVEDSASDAELIADALAEAGLAIAVRRVDDETGLRAAFDERLPDAILADWTLPRYCGRDALTLARERCPAVPFIFVSGTIPESAAFESLRQGATDYLLKQHVQQVGAILIRALEEVQTQRSLRESLAFNRSILDSVSAEIAVLDPDGVILEVNQPWQRFALENGIVHGRPAPGSDIGVNYLAVFRTADGIITDHYSLNAEHGIRAVLDGSLTDFQMEYPYHSPQCERWFIAE